ncbi:hypothetical protein Fot_42339 [Forsythia ovata]|uniref:Uncharacterized protein n=1 Tax=Forsythia ovata TaxID=205694 RepID=A0ABD1RKY0_9LAMI
MDLVEDWVEHVTELSRGHDDPDSDPENWACNQYHYDLSLADFTKLRDLYRVLERELGAKETEKQKTKGAGSDVGGPPNDDDLKVLEEGGLSKKARRPRTASFKSLQNIEAGGDGVPVVL